MKFQDKVVVVTGGTRGIGKAIVQEFLKEGATVIATYKSNDDAAGKFKIECNELPGNLELRKFDVSNSKEVETFFHFIKEYKNRLDILINNSGIREDSMSAMMSDHQWSSVIDTNLTGTFNMTKNAIPLMMSNRFGRIINMSSVGGELGLAGQANYAASKAGQIAMVKSLSKEVGKKGITVNAICPGFIETEMTQNMPEEQIKEYKKQIPLKRFGTPVEVAKACLFIASDDAAYITGTTLKIAGGLSS